MSKPCNGCLYLHEPEDTTSGTWRCAKGHLLVVYPGQIVARRQPSAGVSVECIDRVEPHRKAPERSFLGHKPWARWLIGLGVLGAVFVGLWTAYGFLAAIIVPIFAMAGAVTAHDLQRKHDAARRAEVTFEVQSRPSTHDPGPPKADTKQEVEDALDDLADE